MNLFGFLNMNGSTNDDRQERMSMTDKQKRKFLEEDYKNNNNSKEMNKDEKDFYTSIW